MMLAVASCLVAAFLEAGFLWGRRGFDVVATLGYNFTLSILEVGYPPAWQVLAFGLLAVLGATGREAFRVKAASLEARQAGYRAQFEPASSACHTENRGAARSRCLSGFLRF
jgi:hypothetical protein